MDSINELLNLNYKTESHTFSKGVIASYYNLFKYPTRITDAYILVQRRNSPVLFLLDKNYDFSDFKKQIKNLTIYSENIISKKKTDEVFYNLEELFSKVDTKHVRRAKNIILRKDIKIRDSNSSLEDYNIINRIFQYWKNFKQANPKVFQMTFSPNRYLRSYVLKSKGFKIYEKLIFVNDIPYGAINFQLDGDIAFELSFISRYFDSKLRVINDLNECLLIYFFYDLWKNYGVKKINVGTDAGIKGLKIFKNKLQHNYKTIYTL